MAILNLIGEEDHREEWTRALGQYFRLVRTYNPMTARHEEHTQLLESMAQLKEEWTKPIKKAIGVLDELYDEKVDESLDVVVDYMVEALSFVHKQKIKSEEASEDEKEEAKLDYRKKILRLEKKERKAIEKIWNHADIEKNEASLELDRVGLFSKESASIFGLTQKELVLTSAATGATAGAAIDLIAVGHTLLLGALVGGVVGGVGAMFGFDNLYEVKVLGQNIGKRELSIGPMQNLNFPYVLLGRSLYHASMIAKRSHAVRGNLDLENTSFTQDMMEGENRKGLEKLHLKLRKGDEVEEEILEEYKRLLKKSFLKLL